MEGNVVLLNALAEVTCGVQQLAVRAVVVLQGRRRAGQCPHDRQRLVRVSDVARAHVFTLCVHDLLRPLLTSDVKRIPEPL